MKIGEGSDEHFGGYSELRHDFMLETDPSWPDSLSGTALSELAQKLTTSIPTAADFLNIKRAPASTQRMLNHTSILTVLSSLGSLPFAEWTNIYTTSLPETAQVESLDGQVREAIMNRWHPLHTAEYVFTKGVFSNLLLRYLGDNIDMVHHVETRPPFLDHHLTEYANGLPPSLKIKCSLEDGSTTEKYILREAVRPFITDEIYTRTKKPYLGPTKFPENGPLHQLFLRLTSRENIDALGFVNWEGTREHIRKAFEDKDMMSFRTAFAICQLVVLSQRFGVAQATP